MRPARRSAWPGSNAATTRHCAAHPACGGSRSTPRATWSGSCPNGSRCLARTCNSQSTATPSDWSRTPSAVACEGPGGSMTRRTVATAPSPLRPVPPSSSIPPTERCWRCRRYRPLRPTTSSEASPPAGTPHCLILAGTRRCSTARSSRSTRRARCSKSSRPPRRCVTGSPQPTARCRAGACGDGATSSSATGRRGTVAR